MAHFRFRVDGHTKTPMRDLKGLRVFVFNELGSARPETDSALKIKDKLLESIKKGSEVL